MLRSVLATAVVAVALAFGAAGPLDVGWGIKSDTVAAQPGDVGWNVQAGVTQDVGWGQGADNTTQDVGW